MNHASAVAIVNVSGVVTDDEVRHWVAAMALEVDAFCAAWRIPKVALGFVPRDVANRLRPGDMWMLVVADTPDQAAGLGLHELAANGAPVGYAFVLPNRLALTSISATLSHELWEMLANPTLDKFAVAGTKTYPVEVSDPVEADLYGKWVKMPAGPDVLVSDYCLPAYFNKAEFGPYDACEHLVAPLPALLPEGYLTYRDADGFWGQISAFETTRQRAASRPGILSRRYRVMFREYNRSEIIEGGA